MRVCVCVEVHPGSAATVHMPMDLCTLPHRRRPAPLPLRPAGLPYRGSGRPQGSGQADTQVATSMPRVHTTCNSYRGALLPCGLLYRSLLDCCTALCSAARPLPLLPGPMLTTASAPRFGPRAKLELAEDWRRLNQERQGVSQVLCKRRCVSSATIRRVCRVWRPDSVVRPCMPARQQRHACMY